MGGLLVGAAAPAMAQNDATAELRRELDALRGDYEKRINQLESRIHELESEPAAVPGLRGQSQITDIDDDFHF